MDKTEESWKKLFEEHSILKVIEENGFFEIKSTQINKYRESRLMAKFDHKSNLPMIFSNNNLSILPVTRGSYIISTFDAYHEIVQTTSDIESASLPDNFVSIDPNNLYSESAALHCAYLSGMIDNVLEDSCKFTLGGRMSSSKFDYSIRINPQNLFQVHVCNSQCEIDGGFESRNKLALIEVKNFLPRDFIIRQLFYPYRLWKGKISKEIVPIFMTFSNDVFSFFVYEFEDDNVYNSIHLVGQKHYRIEEEEIDLEDIVNLHKTISIIEEPQVPFPQADSFERIVDLLGLLYNEDLSKEEITTNYDFDERQTDYYTNAAIYLGLIEKVRYDGEISYTLSSDAKQLLTYKHKSKNLKLVEKILSHKVFNESLALYFRKGCLPTKEEVVAIMKLYPVYNVEKDSTFERRSSTIIGWINWILGLQI